MITEQRFAFARLLEGLSDDEWEQPSLCGGWPHSGRAADSRGLRLHATDTDWSAGAGGRTAGTDPNASAAIDRAHHDRAATHVRAACRGSSSAPGYRVPRLTKADHPASTTTRAASPKSNEEVAGCTGS